VHPVNKFPLLELSEGVSGQFFDCRVCIDRLPIHVEREDDILGVLSDKPKFALGFPQNRLG
jgi:hypothetical protein